MGVQSQNLVILGDFWRFLASNLMVYVSETLIFSDMEDLCNIHPFVESEF